MANAGMQDHLGLISEQTAQVIENAFEEDQVAHAIDALCIAHLQGFYPTSDLFYTVLAIVHGGTSAVAREERKPGFRFRKLNRFEWQDLDEATLCKAFTLLKDWVVGAPDAVAGFLNKGKRPEPVKPVAKGARADRSVPTIGWLKRLTGNVRTEKEDDVAFEKTTNPIFKVALRMSDATDLWEMLAIDPLARSKSREKESMREEDSTGDSALDAERTKRILKFGQIGTWHMVEILLALWHQQKIKIGHSQHLVQHLHVEQDQQGPMRSNCRDLIDLISCGLMDPTSQLCESVSRVSFEQSTTSSLAIRLLEEVLELIGTFKVGETDLSLAVIEMFHTMNLHALQSLNKIRRQHRVGEAFLVAAGYCHLQESLGSDAKKHDTGSIVDACNACASSNAFTAYGRQTLDYLRQGDWIARKDWQAVEKKEVEDYRNTIKPSELKSIKTVLSASEWSLARSDDIRTSSSSPAVTRKRDGANLESGAISPMVFVRSVNIRKSVIERMVKRSALQRVLCFYLADALDPNGENEEVASLLSTVQLACFSQLRQQHQLDLNLVRRIIGGMERTYEDVLLGLRSLEEEKERKKRRRGGLLPTTANGIENAFRTKNEEKFAVAWAKLRSSLQLCATHFQVGLKEIEVCFPHSI